jgi:hypothetical protein
LSRSRSRAAALLFPLAFLSPVAVCAADAAFEVAGTLEPAPTGLVVRVSLHNVGTGTAEDVRVSGELLGLHAEAEVSGSMAQDARHDARLVFPALAPPAGVHALVLRIEFMSAPTESGMAALSQWAYLLLAFGGPAAPAVQVEMPASEVEEMADVPVTLESADGHAHRVRLSVYVPRGLAAVPPRQTVEVAAAGATVARVRLVRSTAIAGATHGLLAVAVTEGEPAVHTTATTAVARVGAEPGAVPRVRGLMLAVAAGLLGYAAFAQWRGRDLARRRSAEQQ